MMSCFWFYLCGLKHLRLPLRRTSHVRGHRAGNCRARCAVVVCALTHRAFAGRRTGTSRWRGGFTTQSILDLTQRPLRLLCLDQVSLDAPLTLLKSIDGRLRLRQADLRLLSCCRDKGRRAQRRRFTELGPGRCHAALVHPRLLQGHRVGTRLGERGVDVGDQGSQGHVGLCCEMMCCIGVYSVAAGR